MYDGIIVGGGHAGVEAALAMARKNKKVILITGNLNQVASLPCNPSIGGPAKGVVVREIDALGGQMAKTADRAQIQIKMLNRSKGIAMRALRAQIDKLKYPKLILETLKKQKNLTLNESLVEELVLDQNQVTGVKLFSGEIIYGKTVILTTGTYLRSNILRGKEKIVSGPQGDKTTFKLSEQLKELGFELLRLKTGTPPRIAKDSVDLSKMLVQPGDGVSQTFAFENRFYEDNPYEDCYLTHTNNRTHEMIELHLNESAMYSGNIEGVGPRYCPSIEDKVVRFKTQKRHQIFIEPESVETDEYYVQGFSTSMPKELQEPMLRTIVGLETARITKHGYAIEYDAINPTQLFHTLEAKKLKNLYFAGQINGTSGYEEAAGQGLMAGINAALKVDGKEPFILTRNEAYIAVMIDDLVTKGVDDPYRLLTSRAEHRLLLRHDNAQYRLSEKGREIGLLSDKDYNLFKEKQAKLTELQKEVSTLKIIPNEETLKYLKSRNSALIYEGELLKDLIKRPELNKQDIIYFTQTDAPLEIVEQVEIGIKYQSYIEKEQLSVDKMLRLEHKEIPEDIDYYNINNISLESREKLTRVSPRTLGQANRISGVKSADISVLMIYLESRSK
ncbi:MAG: tRNA uridine-5-carboxymethylaminomethyl(34) synthesis enzyme MnmG [Acholeplasmataceae bacterium]